MNVTIHEMVMLRILLKPVRNKPIGAIRNSRLVMDGYKLIFCDAYKDHIWVGNI